VRAPALLAILAIVTYVNGLRGPFVFDDVQVIVENPHLRQLLPLAVAAAAPAQSAVAGRPLVSLSLAINYAVGGLSPLSYHAANLAVHILAALLLFAIARRHFADRWAFLAAALWLVHPLQTEVIDYVTQRSESMMGLLYLATIYAAIRGWNTAAVVACAAGMATKESMVTAPLMVLLYDATFATGSMRRALRRRPFLYAGLGATWIVLVALNATGPRSDTAGFSTPVRPLDYLLTQSVMIATYLKLAVWPHPLILDYGPVPMVALHDVWLPFALIASLAALVIACWWIRPAVAFLGTWFFVTLAPSSSIVPIATEVGAERRMYLPLAALVVLAVAAVRTLGPRWRPLVAIAGVALMTVLVIVTMRRNAEFLDPVALWQGVVDHRPHARARHALGFALERAGRPEEAMVQYRLAAPAFPLAHYNLALQLAAAGRTGEAIVELRERLRGAPGDSDARGHLADLLLQRGQYGEAADEYARYLQAAPDNAAAHNNFGLALVKLHRVAEAVGEFRAAVALAPKDAGASQNLARALKLLTPAGAL
jgi:protein O-mannosyl-transferase